MKTQQAGFTLVELLLTLGVLAIGLVSIFTLLPGVADFSRELRDDDRMQNFAEAVFASVEWSLRSSESPDLLLDEEKLTFQTGGEKDQALEFNAPDFLPWRSESDEPLSVEELNYPVLFYKLTVPDPPYLDNEVEVILQVRPEFQNEATEFSRVLYPQVKAW